jgi:hypothetical protein
MLQRDVDVFGSAAPSFKCSDIARPMTQSPQPKTFTKLSISIRLGGIYLFDLHQLVQPNCRSHER